MERRRKCERRHQLRFVNAQQRHAQIDRELNGPTGDPDHKPVRVRLHQLETDRTARDVAEHVLENAKAQRDAASASLGAAGAERDRRLAWRLALALTLADMFGRRRMKSTIAATCTIKGIMTIKALICSGL